jgi:hypothetical protein
MRRRTSVWNRACDFDFEPTRTGDKLLRAVVQFDSLAQNGGLGHAIEVSGRGEAAEAVAGLRSLDLLGAAEVVEAALGLDDEEAQESMSADYGHAVEGLFAAFQRYYAAHSGEFDPPE